MAEKTYAKDDLAVVWKPELCIHSAKCVGALPKVFDPDRRPWIDLTAAEAGDIRKAVAGCPSGALGLRQAAAADAAARRRAVASNSPATDLDRARRPRIEGRRRRRRSEVRDCRLLPLRRLRQQALLRRQPRPRRLQGLIGGDVDKRGAARRQRSVAAAAARSRPISDPECSCSRRPPAASPPVLSRRRSPSSAKPKGCYAGAARSRRGGRIASRRCSVAARSP